MAWLSADEQTVKNRNEMMWVQSVFGTAKRRVDELQIDPKMLQVQICSPSQLETYEDLAVDEFTRNTDGFFPADHTKGQWQNGLKTFDPVSVTNHDRTDVEVIRWVQRHAFDATALLSNGTRLAEVLDYPDTSTISAVNEVVKKVHKHMSLGKVVVIRNSPVNNQGLHLDMESFRTLMGDTRYDVLDGHLRAQNLEAVNHGRRDERSIHVRMTADEILSRMTQISNGQNPWSGACLDIAAKERFVSALFRNIAQDDTDNLFRRWKYEGKLRNQKLSTIRDTPMTPLIEQSDDANYASPNGHKGYAIIGSAGFLTHLHCDADGYGTCVENPVGTKLWVIVQPREGRNVREEMNWNVDMVLGTHNNRSYTPLEVLQKCLSLDIPLAFLVLRPGMMLFQPPGIWHIVLTPEHSISVGDHFLTYDTMHLTEKTLVIQTRTNGDGTNATHMQVIWSISRMVISLARQTHHPEMLLKPFLAMARMVLYLERYINPTQYAGTAAIDVVNARHIVKKVLAHNKVPEKRYALPQAMKAGTRKADRLEHESAAEFVLRIGMETWLPIDAETLHWADPGVETISIPDDVGQGLFVTLE
ncbi:hypothetical protein BXZ70DRAFT_1013389 [Cristinia sonorae]|uniref:JmjC domain-containing protein n=1 Tax=Cristinia sonorae TaxID=1940300 RepID=A0A8K0UD47_9AGAR|nr:hypothetical protein BXZ70DRAFT_1013389 [Cristinia sonorae]